MQFGSIHIGLYVCDFSLNIIKAWESSAERLLSFKEVFDRKQIIEDKNLKQQ